MDWFLYDNGLRRERVKKLLRKAGANLKKLRKLDWHYVEEAYVFSKHMRTQ